MSAHDNKPVRVWPMLVGLVAVPVVGAIVVLATDRGPPARSKITQEPDKAVVDEPEPPVAMPEPEQAPIPRDEPEQPTREPPVALPADDPASPDSEVLAAQKVAQARRIENTDPKGARRLLQEAIDADPDNPDALENLAVKTLIDEDWRKARDLASRCAAVKSNSPACRKILELAPEETPELLHLAEGIKDCAQKTPDNVACLSGMVGYHLSDGNVVQAAVFAGRLTQVAPGSGNTQLAQGRLEASRGDYGAALNYFSNACETSNLDEACFRANVLRQEGW